MTTSAQPVTSFSQLFAEIKTEALNAWQAIKNTVAAEETKIVPQIESDLAIVLGQFKGVAVNTVLALAQTAFGNLTGQQKQTITANTIVQSALAQGKTVAMSDAVMLAQQAYNSLADVVATVK